MNAVSGSAQLAIVGATIIDGTGAQPLEDGTLLIENGRIARVGKRGMPLPPSVHVISGHGKFVMPGMMDANVHLFLFTITPAELIRYEGRYEELITESAQVALKSGLTTVFDTWGPSAALRTVRDRIATGQASGSRIFFAGNIIGLGGPTSLDFYPQARTILSARAADMIDARWEQGVGPDLMWMTPPQVRSRVRAYIENTRPDFLKYAASGHAASQFSYITFSAEAQRAIVEEGHRERLTVQAHTTSPESLRMEIEAGADLLQHPDLSGKAEIPQATLDVIAQRQLPCATLLCTERYLAWSESHMPEPYRTFNRIKHQNHQNLAAAGARLLLTSDSGVCPACAAENPLFGSFVLADDSPLIMGEAHFRWLEAAEELGVRPMDALLAATRNVAAAYHVDRELGTLEVGKNADLLVLDRNPLARAANYRSISIVMKAGQVVERDALPTSRLLAPYVSART